MVEEWASIPQQPACSPAQLNPAVLKLTNGWEHVLPLNTRGRDASFQQVPSAPSCVRQRTSGGRRQVSLYNIIKSPVLARQRHDPQRSWSRHFRSVDRKENKSSPSFLNSPSILVILGPKSELLPTAHPLGMLKVKSDRGELVLERVGLMWSVT